MNALFGSAREVVAWINTAGSVECLECYDCDGYLIRQADYGKLTVYGWEIDHAYPNCLGGLDHLTNIRARHWHGNRSAGGGLGSLFR